MRFCCDAGNPCVLVMWVKKGLISDSKVAMSLGATKLNTFIGPLYPIHRSQVRPATLTDPVELPMGWTPPLLPSLLVSGQRSGLSGSHLSIRGRAV